MLVNQDRGGQDLFKTLNRDGVSVAVPSQMATITRFTDSKLTVHLPRGYNTDNSILLDWCELNCVLNQKTVTLILWLDVIMICLKNGNGTYQVIDHMLDTA